MRKVYHVFTNIGILVFWLLWYSMGAAAAGNSTSILGLRECVELAIRNDPDVTNTIDRIRVGQLTEEQAKKDLLMPTLSLETTYGPKLDFFGRPIADESIYFSKASLEKPLYQGGGLINSYRLGRKMIQRARLDLARKQVAVTAKTVKAYYDLLSAQQSVLYYEDLYDQASKTVELLKKKYAMGEALRINVLEAQSRRSNAGYHLLAAKNRLAESKAELNRDLGRGPEENIRVVEEFPIPPLKGDMKALVASALEERADFLYQKEDVAYNKLRVAVNKSRRYPHLSLVGSYSWEGEQFPGDDKEWAVGLRLTFSFFDSTLSSSVSRDRLLENPFNFVGKAENYDRNNVKLSLFDGSSNAVSLEKARADYRLSVNNLAQAKRALASEVQEALNQLKETEALLEATRYRVEYSQEKLKLLKGRLLLRETTELDVFDAMVKLVDAKVKYVKTLYARAVDIVGLYKATGKRLQWEEKPK